MNYSKKSKEWKSHAIQDFPELQRTRSIGLSLILFPFRSVLDLFQSFSERFMHERH